MIYQLSSLARLEAEAIDIIREAVAEARNPVMLFSVGKDSGVMLELARRAFHPGKVPFPLTHIDCCWDFSAMYTLRDELVDRYGLKLVVQQSETARDTSVDPWAMGSDVFTELTLTESLKAGLTAHGFDVVFGGGRRDEEKSRAKERICSIRNELHQWEPRNQRPELWHLFNLRMHQRENMRVFPLSDWTEMDIWMYTRWREIPLVPLYHAARRPVVWRDGCWILRDDERMTLRPGEQVEERMVRFRTLGAYPFTAASESNAVTVEDIIQELVETNSSERSGRVIDADQEAAMERRKRNGYF